MKKVIVSWGAITIGIVAIACIIGQYSENTNPVIYRTLWLVYLNSFFWFGSLYFGKSQIANATKPFAYMILQIYTFASAVVLAVFGACGDASNPTIFHIHLAFQVVLAVVVVLLSIIPFIASDGAKYGTEISADAYVSPQVLVKHLYMLEKQSSNGDVLTRVKALREYVSYSFINTNKVRTNAAYGRLVDAIFSFSEDFQNMDKDAKIVRLNELKTEAEICVSVIVRG